MLTSQEGFCSMDVVIVFPADNYYVWRPRNLQAENVWETLSSITNNIHHNNTETFQHVALCNKRACTKHPTLRISFAWGSVKK